jgi:hypothetical protein
MIVASRTMIARECGGYRCQQTLWYCKFLETSGHGRITVCRHGGLMHRVKLRSEKEEEMLRLYTRLLP